MSKPHAQPAISRPIEKRFSGRLSEIVCPCLGIVGLADVISPPKEMHEIVTALPDARLEEVAGGHMTPMENAEAVTEAIREFTHSRSSEA